MKLKPLLLAATLTLATLPALAQRRLDEFTALLLKQDYAALEASLAAAQRKFEQGQSTEYELRQAFQPLGALRDPQALAHLRKWAAQSPGSYVAHLALGLSYRAQGTAARGRKFWEDTPQEQRDGLINNFTLAEPELRKSVPLTARPYLSLLNLMAIAGNVQNRPFLNAALMLANEALPGNELARLNYGRFLLPRWGGSYEKLDSFIALSQAQGVAPAMLLKLQAIEFNDRGQVLLAERQDTEAEEQFRKALVLAQQAGGDERFRSGYLAASVRRICEGGTADQALCQPTAPAPVALPAAALAPAEPLGGDIAHPVVVMTTDHLEGVRTEYAWLALRFPGARRTAQALMSQDGRQYDRLSVKTADGRDLELYFDITAFLDSKFNSTRAGAGGTTATP